MAVNACILITDNGDGTLNVIPYTGVTTNNAPTGGASLGTIVIGSTALNGNDTGKKGVVAGGIASALRAISNSYAAATDVDVDN